MPQAAVSEGAKSTLDPMQIVSIEDGEVRINEKSNNG